MANTVEVCDLKDHVGAEIEIAGWVETTRSHGKIGFVVVRDGTGVVQCVVPKKQVDEATWDAFSGLAQETSLGVTGEVRADDRAPGGYEITLTALDVLAEPVDEYPIQPKEHGVEFLLDHRHLWLRSSQQRAGLRVRDEVEKAIHDFFYDRDFVRIDTPILTGAIGESAGTLFETDYFGETAYLAQTGQLYVEAAAAAFRKVYCFGPTFRAEKSKTRRHLTEFWMVEPEVAFADSDDNMRLQEEFVSYLVHRALERCADELETLERDTAALEPVKPPFPRVSYDDAVTFLQEEGHEIEWGSDLGAPHEAAISEQYDRPVFVYNYPKEAKAFYMKENPDDPRTVLCDDLLAPEGYGEIIGGSQREDDYDRLRRRIREEQLPEDAYAWYLDLRKYGGFPHSGFGLGLERTVAWITGRRHIRELIPFPRMINRLYP
ncbi:MAG: asparagine--tRNA ligase [Gemmatimonadetes bacterium]|nr:asparagine--tRNA ligase [Gemmatimonadota bacterium]NIU74148.1 asparagine--tRNA ligase [Gammaproteobacteria bacterium]NIP79272.1 asparagine--tRNA ligase [Gemmatimonadota bacterium]NIQ53967.1 asparagine--tRNA ligase [Gemmatimonadota bacterium]NIW38866.1 asparagine--tRNA ligase [Gemmatimonadota bacterium]